MAGFLAQTMAMVIVAALLMLASKINTGNSTFFGVGIFDTLV
jgi:hypothetical protein